MSLIYSLVTKLRYSDTAINSTSLRRRGEERGGAAGILKGATGNKKVSERDSLIGKFESLQLILLKDYEGSKVIRGKGLGFVDALIARKSESVAQAKAATFEELFSFDKAVAQLSGAKPVDV